MTATNDRPLRIAIATAGRFHVLDLARELDKLGHDVRFYSYVPRRRAMKFGLPARCHVPLLPWVAPFLAAGVLLRKCGLVNAAEGLVHAALDRLVAWKLQPCDVFIGMSGMYVRAFLAARQRYGAMLVLERGSVHIKAQREILERVQNLNPHAHGVPLRAVRRELAGYALADRIVVPSLHAEASFLERGVERIKLFRNPYGVDLGMFSPAPDVQRDPKLILFVGGWTYRKGVDALVRAMSKLAKLGYSLQHVGSVGDAKLPMETWFNSAGQVDQLALPHWYQRARCLALPSREDGFGLVLIQALACGCPVIGSSMTGARDLQLMTGFGPMIQVVPVDDSEAVVKAVLAVSVDVKCPLSDAQRAALGWPAYASRYAEMLYGLVAGQRDAVACPNGTHTCA